MRVFHLVKSLGRGGAEMLLLHTARTHRDIELAYGYFLPWKGQLAGDLEATGARVECFGARSNMATLSATPKVARFLASWRPDVVHCHLPIAGVVGRLAGAIARTPVVYTEHNLTERYHPATRAAARATWKLQRQVIAVSDEVAASIDRNHRFSVPVEVVRNGVPCESFDGLDELRAATRASLGLADGHVLVGSVAVFRTQKRLDLWLDVAARTVRDHPSVRFVLVGDGPERANVEGWIRERGLDDVVTLVGLQEDVRPFLAAMDVYLMSSEFEGLPVALLEAMSSRLPPVVTAVGGIAEVIADGENGLLAERHDVAGLARLLATLVESPDRRRRLGAAARATVEQDFSIGRMSRHLETIYERVAARA